MSNPSFQGEFIERAEAIILENISNDKFGVSELANLMNMSRSNLLRKIKKQTQLSASQFISQVRLQKGMELLKETELTVSEISYQVGFGNTSYFIKCFREYYGYPPGEAGRGDFKLNDSGQIDLSSRTHQLAAIMFTDIKGYTALMQRDEVQAIEFRNRHREVFKAVTKKFHGKILQYYGDGTLSTFSSAIDAVRCGIEMQLAFRQEPHIPVRIGIHTGDIVVSKDEIIGDGVNVASRIESLAVAGSVFISEKVYDEVKNQAGIQTLALGVFELKNVYKPMEVFAIANPGLAVPTSEDIAGKLKSGSLNGKKESEEAGKKRLLKWAYILLPALLIALLIFTVDIFQSNKQPNLTAKQNSSKKSIAVLPFINDSNDSTNIYIINGLMESILNNLQRIEDLRVISRTSVEKYRNHAKTIPEIAEELNVQYFVEGSGQKIGSKILLNIQLIDAQSDKHLWSEQYNRETKDVFQLQTEVAKIIADAIEATVTPTELAQLDKKPTENLLAYDYFLQALEPFNTETKEGLEAAIPLFEKAIEHDPQFALAYSKIAISYYFLDVFHVEKKYTDIINNNADKALLYDPKSAESLIAKALYYMNIQEYRLALPHLEKALEYNPNSSAVVQMLSNLYAHSIPNTAKFLKYALKGIQLNIAANDSIGKSYIYLQLGNALIQTGFTDEALKYINLSLDYYPENDFAPYLKIFIQYAKDENLEQTKKLLVREWKKDTTRLDIMQEVAKFYYYQEEYDSAFYYYEKYVNIKQKEGLNIYPQEDLKIGIVYEKMGLAKQAADFYNAYAVYCENDKSIYQPASMAMKYLHEGEFDLAIEQLNVFAANNNYQYWILLFLEIDPLMKNLRNHPKYDETLQKIKNRFWKNQTQLKKSLEDNGLI